MNKADNKLAVLSGLGAFINGLSDGLAQRAELDQRREVEMKKLEQQSKRDEFEQSVFNKKSEQYEKDYNRGVARDAETSRHNRALEGVRNREVDIKNKDKTQSNLEKSLKDATSNVNTATTVIDKVLKRKAELSASLAFVKEDSEREKIQKESETLDLALEQSKQVLHLNRVDLNRINKTKLETDPDYASQTLESRAASQAQEAGNSIINAQSREEVDQIINDAKASGLTNHPRATRHLIDAKKAYLKNELEKQRQENLAAVLSQADPKGDINIAGTAAEGLKKFLPGDDFLDLFLPEKMQHKKKDK